MVADEHAADEQPPDVLDERALDIAELLLMIDTETAAVLDVVRGTDDEDRQQMILDLIDVVRARLQQDLNLLIAARQHSTPADIVREFFRLKGANDGENEEEEEDPGQDEEGR